MYVSGTRLIVERMFHRHFAIRLCHTGMHDMSHMCGCQTVRLVTYVCREVKYMCQWYRLIFGRMLNRHFAIRICHTSMYDLSHMYQRHICMSHMYVTYVCHICINATCVCHICMSHMYQRQTARLVTFVCTTVKYTCKWYRLMFERIFYGHFAV